MGECGKCEIESAKPGKIPLKYGIYYCFGLSKMGKF